MRRFAPLRMTILLLALLAAGPGAAWAQGKGWTVTNEGKEFTIKRSSVSETETVYYRTVSLSAMDAENYTVAWGFVTFQAGEFKKVITVEEAKKVRDTRFLFHNGAGRCYRFEVLDEIFSTVLASCVRNLDESNDYAVKGSYFNKINVELVKLINGNFVSGVEGGRYDDQVDNESVGKYQTVYDSNDYGYNGISFNTTTFFSKICRSESSLRSFLNFIGIKLYATVCFTQKELQDGYQYIQILADEKEKYDGKDPDGEVNTPKISIYKACFEGYKEGNKVPDNEYKWFFPHRSSTYHNNTEFSHAKSYLYQQAFRPADPSFRAEQSGSLVLNPQVESLTVRFDANGSGGDTWQYKDLFVRLTLADDIAPTVLNRSVSVTSFAYKGTPATISIPFSEIVVVEGKPTLTTNWGTFTYEAGSGSNVLAFRGTINASPGTQLSVTGLSGTVKDLAGNDFNWSGTRTGREVMTLDVYEKLETDSKGRYIVSTRNKLNQIAKIVNGGESFEGKTIIVTADIQWNQQAFVPIGTKAHPFKGTFDGDGHVISNIDCSGKNYQGLFGYVDEGTVQNVILRDGSFTGNDYVGGIAGYIHRGKISGCRVESTVTIKAKSDGSDFYGGIAGYLAGSTAEGCYSAASLSFDGHTNCQNYGGIVGFAETVYESDDDAIPLDGGVVIPTSYSGTVRNCLYAGNSLPEGSGIIEGGRSGGSFSNNYCFVKNETNANLARTITLGSGVGLYGTPTSYAASGITAWRGAIRFNEKYYSVESNRVDFSYTGGGVTFGYHAVFSVNGEAFSGSLLTMPAADVTVTAAVLPAASLNLLLVQGTVGGVTACWGTFYHRSLRYMLPEGAAAFTMGSDKHLYRLGDDGRTIPANTAVVIIADNKIITLTKSDEATTVTDHAPGGNILRGSDNAVPLTNGKVGEKIPYVLGKAGNPAVLGFYRYTGSEIPANKAYYEQ